MPQLAFIPAPGRREQIRHAGAQLRGARRETRPHPAGGRAGVRDAPQDHVPLPEDQELRFECERGELRLLPGLQVPRLHECSLPVCHPGGRKPLLRMRRIK